MKEFVIYQNDISSEELKDLNIFISSNSVIQNGAKIYYNSCILGDSIVYKDAVIYNNSTIIDSTIRNGCKIYSSRIENCELETDCVIGPFANLTNCQFTEGNCKVGNFACLKSCVISSNVTINHLTSIENAEIGANTVIGTGVIFSSTEEDKICVGDSVEIGANCSIIGPLLIADDSYVAIGSVIDKDIDANQYAIARVKQQNSEYTSKKAK